MAPHSTDFRRKTPIPGRDRRADVTVLQRSALDAPSRRAWLHVGRHLLSMAKRSTSTAGDPMPLDPARLDVSADGAPIMWTVEETAAFLGLTRHTLDVWRSNRSGGPVYVKIAGNRVRYFPADVRDWLIAQRRGS